MSADFWAGYISGAVGIIVGNPLDLLKTRLQAGSTDVHATSASSLRSNFDKAGTLLRGMPSLHYKCRPHLCLYPTYSFVKSDSQMEDEITITGATAPILSYGALNALLFVSYNRTLTLLDPLSSPSHPSSSLPKIWLAGAAGGLATFVVSAPTELIKCRAQVAKASSPNTPTSSWAIAARIFRAEGIRGLYHGGMITSIRDAVGYGFYFQSYEIARRIFSSPNDDVWTAKYKVLLYGGIAGVVTWASIFPLDVVKTRVQTQPWPALGFDGDRRPLLDTEGQTKVLDRRKGALELARQAHREEGIAVFFRGLGICTARGFIVNAVQFFVYEWVMELLHQGRIGKSVEQI